jgi:hypothetical protein
LQCAQGLMLGQAARGEGDTQGGHDVRDGHPGHDPQRDDLTVRSGQRGDQRREPGAAPGVECSLAVLAGSCGSGGLRREDRRWRHRCPPPKGGATAGTGRPRGPVSGWAAGRGTRSGRDPPEFVRLNPRVPHHAGRNVRGQPGVGKTLTQGATVGGREDPGRRKKHRMTHLRTAGASARVAEHKRRQGPGRVH